MVDYPGVSEGQPPEQVAPFEIRPKTHVTLLLEGLWGISGRELSEEDVGLREEFEDLLIGESVRVLMLELGEVAPNDEIAAEWVEAIVSRVVRGGESELSELRGELGGNPEVVAILPEKIKVLFGKEPVSPQRVREAVVPDHIAVSADLVTRLLSGEGEDLRGLRHEVFEAIINVMGNEISHFIGIPQMLATILRLKNSGGKTEDEVVQFVNSQLAKIDLTEVVTLYRDVAVLINEVLSKKQMVSDTRDTIWELATAGSLEEGNFDNEHVEYYARLVDKLWLTMGRVRELQVLLGEEGEIRDLPLSTDRLDDLMESLELVTAGPDIGV